MHSAVMHLWPYKWGKNRINVSASEHTRESTNHHIDRVFHIKLKEFMRDIRERGYFGKTLASNIPYWLDHSCYLIFYTKITNGYFLNCSYIHNRVPKKGPPTCPHSHIPRQKRKVTMHDVVQRSQTRTLIQKDMQLLKTTWYMGHVMQPTQSHHAWSITDV